MNEYIIKRDIIIPKRTRKESNPIEIVLRECNKNLAVFCSQGETDKIMQGNETAFNYLKGIILTSLRMFSEIDEEQYSKRIFNIIHQVQEIILRTEFKENN